MPRAKFAHLLFLLSIVISVLLFCSKTRAEEINYSWSGKIVEAKFLLSKMKLAHSAKAIVYKEIRKVASRSSKKTQSKKTKTKTITIKRTDYAWKEIGIAIMNINTCVVVATKIKKEGQSSYKA